MPKRSERTKKKRYRRRISGKVRVDYIKGKLGKQKCAICKGVMQGVPHGKKKSEIRKLAKSKKRPSVMFGGVLCGSCRNVVFEEAIKVKHRGKKIEDVDLNIKNYVGTTLKGID